MKITNLKKIGNKKMVVFDLDGTIALTKSPMDAEMAELFKGLLDSKKVAVISGGKLGLFKIQILNPLKGKRANLKNLFLFPNTGTAFYKYDGGWKNVYQLTLTKDEKKNIEKTFERVFAEVGYKHPSKVYGKVIEDRGSQVTFSALGQDVVAKLGIKGVRMKEAWRDKYSPLKLKMAKLMQKYLPDLEVRAAAFTSIDITKKGIDKSYGIRQMEKHLRVKAKDMLFVGDAIFPGGNDYAVVKTEADYYSVKSPEDTKQVIRSVIGE